MIAASWRETSSTIIQNCFRKAGFKHHAVDPASKIEEDTLPAPAPDVWNRVQRWLGDVQFDEFVARELEAPTAQPMSDQDIVDLVCTENDPRTNLMMNLRKKFHLPVPLKPLLNFWL